MKTAQALPAALLLLAAAAAHADDPPYLADRGSGISMSQFGTFVEPGDRVFYLFYEYTRTTQFEYHPSELGSTGGEDFLGRLTDREGLVYFAYGLSDRLAVELEGALYAKSTFEKAPDDPSDLPSRFSESGIGDVEGQLRWRWRPESETHSELYSYLEVVFPLQENKLLIGTQHWEGALGLGILRGHSWGTIGGRIALAWDGEDSRLELGEYAFEYLKRLSPRWRVVALLEGESQEVSLIGEAQLTLSEHALLKLNCGFGLTQQAPEIAPEIGLMIRF